MKKIASKILISILFLAGLSLLLYPLVANEWNNYRQKRLISNYDQIVAEKEAAGAIDYEAERKLAEDYNRALLPSILPDSFADVQGPEGDASYMSCLNVAENGVMGTVEIPKINIKIPIFHTTEEEVLETAAGHLEGSSLPIGGADTHAVISAHRGLPSAALFTDLDKMEEGDHFLLHVLEDTLSYEIDKISVVKPEDTQDLAVEDGMDFVTLLTCTPYGVNSHRLLVRGHRVPYEEADFADEKIPLSNMSLHTNYLLWVVVGILVTAIFSFFLYRREKKRKVKPSQQPEGQKPGIQEGKSQAEEGSPSVQEGKSQAEEVAPSTLEGKNQAEEEPPGTQEGKSQAEEEPPGTLEGRNQMEERPPSAQEGKSQAEEEPPSTLEGRNQTEEEPPNVQEGSKTPDSQEAGKGAEAEHAGQTSQGQEAEDWAPKGQPLEEDWSLEGQLTEDWAQEGEQPWEGK